MLKTFSPEIYLGASLMEASSWGGDLFAHTHLHIIAAELSLKNLLPCPDSIMP